MISRATCDVPRATYHELMRRLILTATLVAVATVTTVTSVTGFLQDAPGGQPDALALQVALDRAGFSSGVIDGQLGSNTRRALDKYRERHGSNPSPAGDALLEYTITSDDVKGPFVGRIPPDLMAQAELPSLTYGSLLEALAERFHTTPALLKRVNPGAVFEEGARIRVPNVDPFIVPAPRLEAAPRSTSSAPTGTAGREGSKPGGAADVKPLQKPEVVVTVSKSTSALTVRNAQQQVIFYAPVTTGSQHDPLPIGEWKVNGIQFSPKFQYNPELFWDADPVHAKATIPTGPNNPVGVVWIDLSKEHYGIHGTPEPAAIGRAESHGCVRLTNWDALRLAGLVKPGTRVVFEQ